MIEMLRQYLCGGIFLLLIFSGGCWFFSIEHKTDAELAQSFSAHRADFEQLAVMFREDEKLQRIRLSKIDGNTFETIDESELSAERKNQYVDLLNKIAVKSAEKADSTKNSEIYFAANVRQLDANDADEKGFAFFIGGEKPAALEESLDKIQKERYTNGSPEPFFKNLDGKWYLYFRLL